MTTLPITPIDLMLASGLLLVAGLVSLILRLGLEGRIATAAARMVVQLLLVGLVLRWVFALDRGWVVIAILLSMVLNAGVAGVRRSARRYPGIWTDALLAVSVSCVLVTFTVTEVVLEVDPWYAPRYLIPLLGMVLGNTLTGLSLCLDRVMADLDTRRDEVEGWLSLGATGWEACRPIVAEAARTGMVPILNTMTVAGIVSLPGMMTGQILAGAPPEQAVKYQIVVIFMIAAAAALGSLLAALLATRRLLTPAHQLAAYRLRPAASPRSNAAR